MADTGKFKYTGVVAAGRVVYFTPGKANNVGVLDLTDDPTDPCFTAISLAPTFELTAGSNVNSNDPTRFRGNGAVVDGKVYFAPFYKNTQVDPGVGMFDPALASCGACSCIDPNLPT